MAEIVGTPGNDKLRSVAPGDTLRGLGGDDSYFILSSADIVLEEPGQGYDIVYASVSYALRAGQEIEVLGTVDNRATTAINLTGNELKNLIVGNAGANVLDGGAGVDSMHGRGGNDSYFVDHAGDAVFEAAGEGYDIVYAAVSYRLAAGQEIEVLGTVDDRATTAINLIGNEFGNLIVGNAGNNVLNGGGGADSMHGRAGNDTYHVDHAGDVVFEAAGEGYDIVYAAVSHTLAAGQEIEVLGTIDNRATTAINLTGNELKNLIVGNAGANVLDGGGGADSLHGRGGNDSYFVDHAGDRVFEAAGEGYDIVYAAANYALAAGQEIEVLGTVNNFAGTAINLTGNEFDNLIVGNAGDNILDGGLGRDVLDGRAGGDTYAFTTALGPDNVDTVLNFETGIDRILLGGFAGQPFVALATGALAAFAFRTGSAAVDADDRILYDAATGALLYDPDGAGGAAAVQFAVLAPGLALSAADFLVSGAPNNAPTISSGGTATVEENVPVSTIVYQAVAQDPDGDSFVFRLSGADASRFTIDGTGAVRFVSSPDYETQNVYNFTVEAVDSSGAAGVRAVKVTVTDVAENSAPYLVEEKADANDSVGSAQGLDRTKFSVTDNPNLPDPSLPSAVITGNVAAGGDRDFYSVTLKAGELLILDVDGTNSLDAFVRVYNASGVELTFSDDQVSFDPGSSPHSGASHNLDSLVKFRAPADGTYYFSIASYPDESGEPPSSSGAYTINVSIGPPATREQINEENIQALMSGLAWSTLDLTYGFPSSGSQYGPGEGTDEIGAGMSQLNQAQQNAVRTMLTQIAGLTNLSFTELPFNPGGAQLRFALSNEPETAFAYYPGPGNGGDSWYNTTKYTNPVVGNYQYLTFLHETGHALGLKHGHEAPALSFDRDSMEYSVMTYRSYIGDPLDDGGYRNETWGFAQTLMMYDIAALQRMYGADFGLNAGDTVYSWSPTTGAFMINGAVQWTPGGNRVFMTVWDGGGTDTYDLSNYANAVTIDLRPGEWTITSPVQLANLGNGNMARGNVANALLYNGVSAFGEGDPRSLIENAVGGSAGDILIFGPAVNRMTGGAGNDLFRLMSASDSRPGSADVVADFLRGADRIDLSFLDGRSDLDGLNPFEFIGTAAFGGATDGRGQVRYETAGNAVHVFGDVDADGIADFQLVLEGVTALAASDFVF